jgi:tRNA nucleotidyltransferase (CCA-adding enzyme)
LVQIDTHDQLPVRASEAAPIAEIAQFVGASAADVYVVGGAVRDLILGRPFADVDLAVDGDPAKLAAAIGTPSAGETRFGTLSVERNGFRYDLARTRSERYPRPGALPAVEPAGIDADLARRDFTANAIALALSGPRTGELLSAPEALADIEARQLAVLHDASFIDDPTRLLRLARYAARLGFEPAPHTRDLAAAAIAGDALATISGTRVGNELRLLATEPDPVAAFDAVAALGLPWTIDAPLARAALAVLPEDGRRDRLVLACVLNSAKPPNEQLVAELERLGFTASDRDVIAETTAAPELARRLVGSDRGSQIAQAVGTSGIETVALASSQGAPSQSLTWLRDLRHRTLEITGDDLIQHGLSQGPEIGEALTAARSALMDGTATNRESQLRVALESAE